MKITKLALVFITIIAIAITGCKPKDSEIKVNIEKALSSDPATAGTYVSVAKGMVTLTGQCKDDACKATCEKLASAVKGVKLPITNNCTVAAPIVETVAVPESVNTTMDATVMQTIKDGLKDIKGVMVDFSTGKPVLSGTVSASDRMKIMQMMASAKILPDVKNLVTKK